MPRGVTPASGEHVPAVVSGPVVEGAPPPVEGDIGHLVVDLAHRGAEGTGLLLETLVKAINCILESSSKKLFIIFLLSVIN